MKKLIVLCAAAAVALAASSVNAADLFKVGQTTITTEDYTLTVDNNFKFVNYMPGEVLSITLNYSYVSANTITVDALTQRAPQPFTPKGTKGTFAVTGGTDGSVTFDIAFTDLKKAGKKQAGVAHLDLVFDLGVDSDLDGNNDTFKVGVQVSVSTARRP